LRGRWLPQYVPDSLQTRSGCFIRHCRRYWTRSLENRTKRVTLSTILRQHDPDCKHSNGSTQQEILQWWVGKSLPRTLQARMVARREGTRFISARTLEPPEVWVYQVGRKLRAEIPEREKGPLAPGPVYSLIVKLC
jgi:hypothetical protein